MNRVDLMKIIKWRRSIPFTNEQIATALELQAENEQSFVADRLRSHAAWLRKSGRLSGRTLAAALPRLVTHCGCGKLALFRIRFTGYCATCKPKATRRLMKIRSFTDPYGLEKDADIQRDLKILDKVRKHRKAKQHWVPK